MNYESNYHARAKPTVFPQFFERARMINGSRGLTPGLPQQFHYVELKDHPTYTHPEYTFVPNDDQVGIPQYDVRHPITGYYDQSLPSALPFDPIHDEKVRNRLLSLGFGLIGIAATMMT